MKKRAEEFLALAAKMYEKNKRKWSNIVDGFDDDIYSDTIIKVYDSILKGADTDGDLQGYWFKSFKNNINKKCQKDVATVNEQAIKDKEDEENMTNIYYSAISNILLKVKHHFNRKTFEVFRMYLLCNMSYEQLDKLTGVDSKERISKVRKWLNDNEDIRRVGEGKYN